jgi:tetratricopeptide (TPR) repeat protein
LENKYQIEHKLKMAKEFEVQGKLLHALQLYQAIINEFPSETEAYYSLADIYEQTGNIEPAIEILEGLLDDNPENKEVRLFMGQYLLRNNLWNDAIDVLSYILPDEEPLVSFFLGYAYFMLKDYELARINYINFISCKVETELIYEANLHLAKIEIELRNYERALKYAKKSEALYSNFWELNQIYAICYYNLDMNAHAVSPIEKAIKLNPKESSSYKWAGKIYMKLGDFLKAEKKFIQCLENQINFTPDIYVDLAEACLKGKKISDALRYYETAIKLDPENKIAREGQLLAARLYNKNATTDA